MIINPLNILKGLGASFIIAVSLVVMIGSINSSFNNSDAGLPAGLTGGGPIIASISISTPPSTTIATGQALAPFIDILFTGQGTVNSITFQRGGFSSNNDLSAIYLFDGNTRLTDAKTFDSNGIVIFNNLNITVNGSKTISLKADVSLDAFSGSTINISLIEFNAGFGAEKTRLFGNSMAIANINPRSEITFYQNVVKNSNLVAPKKGYKFWSTTIGVEKDPVALASILLKMDGTAKFEYFSNPRLLLNGKDIGPGNFVNQNGNKYVEFNFNPPVEMKPSEHILSMNMDVKSSAKNSTVQISLDSSADVSFFYPRYNLHIVKFGIIPNIAGLIRIIGLAEEEPQGKKTLN